MMDAMLALLLDLDSPAKMAARADKIFDSQAANPSSVAAVNHQAGHWRPLA
jgi:hypothetical protein